MEQLPKSITESAELTRQISDVLGGKVFGGIFHATPSAVCQWISRGTGPLYWIRRMLVEIDSEGHQNLVTHILTFLCKPFYLIPVKIPTGSKSYISILRAIAEHGRESADIQTVFADIVSDGKINQKELEQLLQEIEQDLAAILHLKRQAEFLLIQTSSNGGMITLDNLRSK